MKGLDRNERTLVSFLNLGLCTRRLNTSVTELKGIRNQLRAIQIKEPNLLKKAGSGEILSPEELALLPDVIELLRKKQKVDDNIKFEENTIQRLDQILLYEPENVFFELLHDVCTERGLKDSEDKRILLNWEKHHFVITIKKITGEQCEKNPNRLYFKESGMCVNIQPREQGKLRGTYKKVFNFSCEMHREPVKVWCSCDREFFTFNKNQIYCTPKCKNEANLADREKRKIPSKKLLPERICPECHDSYSGNARTCGKSACSKRDYRARKTLEL